MPTCRIIFSGLCAFIPHGGKFLDLNDPPESITALLPNVLVPKPIDPEYEDIIIPPHFPLLEFRLRYQSTGNTRDFLLFVKSSDEFDMGLHPLLRREIEIWIDGYSPASSSRIECVHRPEKPYLDDDLYWLIQLNKTYGPCAVKPELLSSLVGYDHPVITRIELTTGTFMTYEVMDDWYPARLKAFDLLTKRQISLAKEGKTQEGAPDLYDVEPPARKVATKMALEFDFDEEVALVMKEYGGKDPRTLVFTPPQDRPLEDVEIVIKNLEANEHFGIPTDPALLATRDKSVFILDPDFEIYRDFLIFPPEKSAVLKVLASPLTTGFGKPCSPVGIPESLQVAAATTSQENGFTNLSRLQEVATRRSRKRSTGHK